MQMTPQGSVRASLERTSLLFAYVISLLSLPVGLMIAECLHTQLLESQCHRGVQAVHCQALTDTNSFISLTVEKYLMLEQMNL